MPRDVDCDPVRPDICLGTDPFHTPPELLTAALEAFADEKRRVAVDRPYAGADVSPLRIAQLDELPALAAELG